MEENFSLFTNWTEYLKCMATPQVWATELELKALACYLNCPIALLAPGVRPKMYNPIKNGVERMTPIFLHHSHENHFEACFPIKGLTSEEIYNYIKRQPHY